MISLNRGTGGRIREERVGIHARILRFTGKLPSISLFVFLVSGPYVTPAAESGSDGLEFFEQKIRPLLVENCYKCHSHQSEKIKGGLLLDTREGVLKGGDSGPAVVPGKPEDSLVIKAVRYTDKELQMPPKDQKLSAGQIANLELWIKLGLPDPRSNIETPKSDYTKEKASTHWAFQPVVKPVLPSVRNKRWIQSPIDAFVLKKLETRGMTPAPQADKRTLIRRAT